MTFRTGDGIHYHEHPTDWLMRTLLPASTGLQGGVATAARLLTDFYWLNLLHVPLGLLTLGQACYSAGGRAGSPARATHASFPSFCCWRCSATPSFAASCPTRMTATSPGCSGHCPFPSSS